MDYWTQGMQRHRPRHTIDWQEVLYKRIETRHLEIPSGPKTAEAETGLRLPKCAYFYVGRSDPSFGEHALIFGPPASGNSAITPFDTGGLWYDHVITKPPTPPADKGAFVARASFGLADYYPNLANWARGNFSNKAEYVLGVQPTATFTPAIDLDASGLDSRCWTWEARTPKSECHVLAFPRRLFLQRQQRNQYLTWLRNNSAISRTAKTDHLDHLYAILEDAGDTPAGTAANEWIIRNGAW